MIADAALRGAAAGGVALAFGGGPLGVLLIARRMSLSGDALSHGVLPGAALAYLFFGANPWALTIGALAAALAVTAASSLLARSKRLPEDAAFAVIYLPALALGVLLLTHRAGPEALEAMLFGAAGGLDRGGLFLAAGAASVTLIAMALFARGFVAESVDPGSLSVDRRTGALLHVLLMMLVALNLVAGFRAFGALMTVALMMIPAASARFWARGYGGQTLAAIALSAASSTVGLIIAAWLDVEPGAVMTLTAAALFAASAVFGPQGGVLIGLRRHGRLEARARLS